MCCAVTFLTVNELLGRIIDAHGGIDRWKRYGRVEATIVSGRAAPRVFQRRGHVDLSHHAGVGRGVGTPTEDARN